MALPKTAAGEVGLPGGGRERGSLRRAGPVQGPQGGRFCVTAQAAAETGRSRPERDDWARHGEGCYILRTNVTDGSAEDLGRTDIQLTEAEAAFRIQKSDLSIRPVWHQKTDRVKAHILVCFLAHVLWKTHEQWQRRAGLGNSPRVILAELARIQNTDVILGLAGDFRREIRLRCVVRPDPSQAALLDRQSLRLPEG